MMRYLAVAAVLIQLAAAEGGSPVGSREFRMAEAASAGDLKQVTKLLDAGLPVSAMLAPDDYKGEAPKYQAIHLAAYRGHVAVIRLLLDRGANVNGRTS